MSVKILTLNLFLPGSNDLFLNALDFLDKERADIMFLQEVYDGDDSSLPEKFRKREEIKKLFPDYYDAYFKAFTDTRSIEGNIPDGNLTLSRFPLENIQENFIDTGHRYADHDSIKDFSNFPAGFLSCETEINGKEVQLINVHGPVNNNGTENDPRRQKLADKLSVLTCEPANMLTVIAGDSNAQPSTDLIQGLEEQLYNPFANQLKTTFNLKRKNLEKYPGFANAVVDILMVSKDIQVEKSWQPQVDVSDHLPLITLSQIS